MKYEPQRPVSQKFVMGYVGAEKYWTNQALADENGSLTNVRLMAMSDEQLKKLAFVEVNGVPNVAMEAYRRPVDEAECKKQGGEPSAVYQGLHRAVLVLKYRDDKKRYEGASAQGVTV